MAAERAGTDVEELRHLVALGILQQEIVDAAAHAVGLVRQLQAHA